MMSVILNNWNKYTLGMNCLALIGLSGKTYDWPSQALCASVNTYVFDNASELLPSYASVSILQVFQTRNLC